MVIDSFKALRAYATDEGAFRRFLHHLAGRLSAVPVTSFWVGEYDGADAGEAAEFAVADAILLLSTDRTAERETRVLQVLKLRGSGYLTGQAHLPALAPRAGRVPPAGRPRRHRRLRGHPGTDVLRASPRWTPCSSDGYWRGASTVIAGPSGIGKTLLALHFVFAGARPRRNRGDRHLPGKPRPTRTDPARLLLVVARPRTSS